MKNPITPDFHHEGHEEHEEKISFSGLLQYYFLAPRVLPGSADSGGSAS
ncbi:MAG: hypothetical protein HZA01_04780 [Nitrospinae bacterium]|nr:hypothetical protein [Nitrospinota bacterium]